MLRSRGIQVTAQRLAVWRAVSNHPHVTADGVADAVRAEIGAISRQSVYDALAVLAAHFYRAQNLVAVGMVAALFALFFIRTRWAGLALQASLVIGALEWIRTAAGIAAVRESMGQPWTRMAIILGAVALATAASALAVRSARARRHFGHPA